MTHQAKIGSSYPLSKNFLYPFNNFPPKIRYFNNFNLKMSVIQYVEFIRAVQLCNSFLINENPKLKFMELLVQVRLSNYFNLAANLPKSVVN